MSIMHPARSFIVATVLLTSSLSQASASDLLVELVMGACYLNGARYEPLVALAEISKWETAPEEALPLLKPAIEPSQFGAWVVRAEDELAFVAGAVTPLDGIERSSCAVAGQMDFADFEPVLQKLDARLVEEVDEVIQYIRMYETHRFDTRYLISIGSMDGGDGPDLLVVAVTAD